VKDSIPTEYEEQKALVEYLEFKGLKFSSIPNSTWTSSWGQKTKNKQSGLRPGMPDMIIILPQRGLLFIEMKRVKGGVVSEVQREWIQELTKLDGVEAVVCRGADEAIQLIETFT